jgi:hypothetical protein
VTREDDLEALATGNGWTFSIEDPDDLLALPFRFFTNGVAHGTTDVIEGERDGRDFVAFDYSWGIIALGAAEAPMTSDSSCVVTALPATCPEVMVSHTTATHRFTHPGHHEDFASERPEFARAYHVTGSDPAFTAGVFSEDVERWFLEELGDAELCFEIAGPWLMGFTRRRDPAEVPALIDATVAFTRLIPGTAFEGLPDPSSAT